MKLLSALLRSFYLLHQLSQTHSEIMIHDSAPQLIPNMEKLGFALSTELMAHRLKQEKIAEIAAGTQIKKFRLYGWPNDPDLMKAILAKIPDASFAIEIPPHQVDSCADNYENCLLLLRSYQEIDPKAIQYIAVGNEPLLAGAEATFSKIPQAVRNVARAQRELKLDAQVTVPFSMDSFDDTWPPEFSHFVEPDGFGNRIPSTKGGMMDDILNAIQENGGKFAFHPYPWFVARSQPEVPVEATLNPFGVLKNQLTSAEYALQKLGHEKIPIIITETGWPSEGTDPLHRATLENACAYVRNVAAALDFPPFQGKEIFVFELIDEEGKEGEPEERHFGFLNEGGKPKCSEKTKQDTEYHTEIIV